MKKEVRFVVSARTGGQRLDQVLAGEVEGLSRTRARSVLAEGGVFVDGKRTKVASRVLQEGQRVRVHLGANLPRPGESAGPLVKIPIVWQNDALVVVDKPSGVFSAPTPESDRHDLLAYLKPELGLTAGSQLHLVHRLDRPTSGLMVIAKTSAAAASMSEQLARHTASRKYYAILAGSVEDGVRIDQPLSGQAAVTLFRPLEHAQGATLVEVELATGRTHQIRRHADWLGNPVLGDSKYGRGTLRRVGMKPPRLALHAFSLRLVDPLTQTEQSFLAPFPPELRAFWQTLGGRLNFSS